MTSGELAGLIALYVVGVIIGAMLGRSRGSMWLGIGATALLGPLLGIPVLWALKGGPVPDLDERLSDS